MTTTQMLKKTLCATCKYRKRICDKYGTACYTAMEAGYKPSMVYKFKKPHKSRLNSKSTKSV